MSLAEQPPAFESADASALRLMWVHPEVALLHGPLTLPLEAGDSAETVSTLVFVVGDSGWEFRRGFGMAPPAEVR
jgi:hypothetical protein